jgi:NADH-quinone oxidoreductase subunit L
MMIALGTGGVAAAMFHLIAHAFFKALLFLSAGSVIHGCHEEQDIRRMGGLRRAMPWTFAAYAVGMMALAGFPFVFSGFWSKEAILHSAQHWHGGPVPFALAVAAALLTAFYMTRQAVLVFFGTPRAPGVSHPHESSPVLLVPLFVLAAGAVLLSVVGTPLWPWFEEWLQGKPAHFQANALSTPAALQLIGLSLALVTVGVGASWLVYRNAPSDSTAPDALGGKLGRLWTCLGAGLGFDALYERAVVQPLAFFARGMDLLERRLFVPLLALGENVLAWFGRFAGFADESGLNDGFDSACAGLQERASEASRTQTGQPQSYLRPIGATMSVLLILYFWLVAGS